MRYLSKALVYAVVFFSTFPASAATSSRLLVTRSAVMNAPVATIWAAIKTNRESDPAHRQVVSHQGCDYQVRERFERIPIIGTVNCLYSEHEIAGKRIEYKLITSDKFVAFEGTWELSSRAGGRQTTVTLTSFADSGLHIPFAAKITEKNTAKSVEKRLNEVKSAVERQSLAASG